MKLSLPRRIFFAHLIFMVALGGLGAVMIRGQFRRYERRWMQNLDTVPAEKLFAPLASEVARSLLLTLEHVPEEPGELDRTSVREAIDRVLAALPSIDRLVIVDSENRVQYASEPAALDLVLREEHAAWLETEQPRRRPLAADAGITEVVIPIRDGERRLGSALVHHGAHRAGPGPAASGAEAFAESVAGEIARSVLVSLDDDPERRRESYRHAISDGLETVLDSLPIEALVIVDEDRRIQFINDKRYLDLTYTGEEHAARFAARTPSRRPIESPSGEPLTELIQPVFDPVIEEGSTVARRKIGSVLIRYRPDPGLSSRIPEVMPPPVGSGAYLKPLILYLALAVGGGILLAALSGVPIRRLERALDDFRARGFKGGLDLPSDFPSTVEALSEMGGRLEALDAQGSERVSLLATLSQSLEDGMVAVDPEGVPLAWNPASLRILLAASGEPTDERAAADRAAALRQALERNPDLRCSAGSEGVAPTREVEIERPDGSRTAARATRVPFQLRPGETGTLLLIRDLAALRKVESHLLEAGRFAVLAHLAAGLAHEIRNPLNAIRINATVVEQYVGRSGEDRASRAVADSLTTIKDETQRLTELLNNYLGMVQPGNEAGPVDMRDLCRRVIQLVDYAARRSHVEIRLEDDGTPPLVHGAPNRLQQAVLNLVLNAIQAMPDGGRLTLATSTLHDLVRVTVSDTGPGLSQELADQLFDTRVTTKPGGTGLGLPVVRLIAESHGGGVWYRSNPGQGASFTLVLPTHDGARASAAGT